VASVKNFTKITYDLNHQKSDSIQTCRSIQSGRMKIDTN